MGARQEERHCLEAEMLWLRPGGGLQGWTGVEAVFEGGTHFELLTWVEGLAEVVLGDGRKLRN